MIGLQVEPPTIGDSPCYICELQVHESGNDEMDKRQRCALCQSVYHLHCSVHSMANDRVTPTRWEFRDMGPISLMGSVRESTQPILKACKRAICAWCEFVAD